MSQKWDDTFWQQEFLEMKAYKSDGMRLLKKAPRGVRDAWDLGPCRIQSIKKRYQQLQKEKKQQ